MGLVVDRRHQRVTDPEARPGAAGVDADHGARRPEAVRPPTHLGIGGPVERAGTAGTDEMWMACSASGRLAIGRAKLMIGLATPTIAPFTGLNDGGANTGSPVNGSGFWPLTLPAGAVAAGWTPADRPGRRRDRQRSARAAAGPPADRLGRRDVRRGRRRRWRRNLGRRGVDDGRIDRRRVRIGPRRPAADGRFRRPSRRHRSRPSGCPSPAKP